MQLPSGANRRDSQPAAEISAPGVLSQPRGVTGRCDEELLEKLLADIVP